MKVQNVLTIGTALVENLLFSGILLGWPSFQYVLLKEGYFEYLCNPEDIGRNSSHTHDTDHMNSSLFNSCMARDERLNLAFAIATSSPFLFSLFSGILLDKLGTWMYRCMGTCLLTTAFFAMSLSSIDTSWLIFPFLMMIGIAGSTLAISNVQVANLAGPFKGLVVSLLNGSFLAAAVVFMIVKAVYLAGLKISWILLILAFLSIISWFRTFLLMPKKYLSLSSSPRYGWKEWTCYRESKNKSGYGAASTAVEDESANLTKEQKEDPDVSSQEVEIANQFGNDAKTFKLCICSPIYWTNLLTFTVGHTRLTFYYGAFVNWIECFEESESISFYINIFAMTLLVGVLLSPVCGLIFDGVVKLCKRNTPSPRLRFLQASLISMFITSSLLTLLSVTVIISSVYSSIAFLLLTSLFLYAGHWTFLALIFPTKYYGKLLGITQGFAGTGALLQFFLFSFAVKFDPNFTLINYGFLGLSVLTFVHPLILFLKIYRIRAR